MRLDHKRVGGYPAALGTTKGAVRGMRRPEATAAYGLAIAATLSCGVDSAGSDQDDPSAPALSTTATMSSSADCEELGRHAQAQLTNVLSKTAQCDVDADCVNTRMPEQCWGSCSDMVMGSEAYQRALRDAFDGATGETCAQFRARGCVVAAPGCPTTGVEPTGFTCEQAQCVAQFAE